MKRSTESRRRPNLQITLARASRLHQLVGRLAEGRQTRDSILSDLAIGLRTFYRELELLKKCGIKVSQTSKTYELMITIEEAQGRLPFPDPQLSFAEMKELTSYPGEASKRLAKIFEIVTKAPAAKKPRRRAQKEEVSRSGSKGKKGKGK